MLNAIQNAYCEEMKNFYGRTSFTHEYLFGWIDGDKIMATFIEWSNFSRLLLKNDKAATSKGGMLKIRVRADSKARAILKKSAFIIGNIDELTSDKKHNRGENFERIVTEKLCGEQWQKDSIPYYKAGDIVYKGKSIQVKFDGAELTNAKTYENIKTLLA
jgi:hypothetical protein